MWEARSEIVDSNVHKVGLFENDFQLSYEKVMGYWRESIEFRDFYFSILHASPFNAFFWENPPITTSNAKQAYEFVLVNSLQLSRVNANPNSFLERFNSAPSGQSVIAFENLGRDAELIVPCPVTEQNVYAHFATFMRGAPKSQVHDLFVTLANSLSKRMSNQPTWVSTSGLGVYWLHIRLDTRPKYYSYQDYRQFVE